MHDFSNYCPRIGVGDFDNETSEIDTSVVVGCIADGTNDCERNVEFEADLGDGGTFHFNTLDIRKEGEYFFAFFIAVDELVAAGDVAEMECGGEMEFFDGCVTNHLVHTFY